MDEATQTAVYVGPKMPDPYNLVGPAYPSAPYPGQQFYLTTGTPGIYVYVGGAWAAFISNSIAPPGAS